MKKNTNFDSIASAADPSKVLPAIVRAHIVEEATSKSVQAEFMQQYNLVESDSYWPSLCLIIHTETDPDEFTNLRYGNYIVEWFNPIVNEVERVDDGFFLGEGLNQVEKKLLEDYCKAHNLNCLSRRDWLEDIFFTFGYRARGVVAGYDLLRQLASIATRAGAIRLATPKVDKDGTIKTANWFNKLFAGGWKLVFNEREKKDEPGQWRERGYRPSVWIKPISSTAAMYRWGYFLNWQERSGIVKWPYRKAMEANSGKTAIQENQGKKDSGDSFYAGHFLDLRILGLALSKDDEGNSRKNRSLRRLGELFGASILEPETSMHEGLLNELDLDRAMNKAEAVLSLYYAELEEYRKHALTVTPYHIYSSASLGKAYLKSMGIITPPMLDTSKLPFTPDQVLGFAMSAYYPGRSEAHIVNLPVPITYLDFHSMYPAICILQGMFDLMKAKSVQAVDATTETIEFLEKVLPEDSFHPETWKRLNVLCLVEPQGDIFPIRADFRLHKPQGASISHRPGLAMITSAKQPMWWPLADCLESKARTGKPPHILKAIKFSPVGSRPLKPFSIRGGPSIDPNQEDFFQALVEARDQLGKNDPKLAAALKIVTNSISYGIWAEVDIEAGERTVSAFGTEQRNAVIPHGEKAGRYYYPIFAALITSGARHMLGLLEGEVERLGGVTAFCDTDSLAIVSSKKGGKITYPDHHGKTQELPVLTWNQVDDVLHKFDVLNPYRSGKLLIKLEPENFLEKNTANLRANLYAYVIAAKRYALFVPAKGSGSLPKIVKASYHTLGIVEPPQNTDGGEIEDWIEEFWAHIAAGLPYNPSWVGQFVEFRVDINRPEIRNSFRKIRKANQIDTGNKYMERYLAGVKPFSAVAVLAKSRGNSFMVENVDESNALKDVPIIAPLVATGQDRARLWVAKTNGRQVYLLPPDRSMDVNERQAIREAIERERWLVTTPMTFAELMADYLSHHESKVSDAYGVETNRDTRGLLYFPRVRITELLFTGKESVLREELERGFVSQQEEQAERVMIRSEQDPLADLVIEVLRLLTKVELKNLEIGRRFADKIYDDGDQALGDVSIQERQMFKIAKYLQDHYPDEVSDRTGEEALREFVKHRTDLLGLWQRITPELSRIPTKELMKIAGCSRGTAKNIKYGRTTPSIEIIKKIVYAQPTSFI